MATVRSGQLPDRRTGDVTFRFVDAHVHLDAYPSPSQVLRDAAEAGVIAIAMTETPSTYRRLRVGVGNNPAIRVALGMHPQKAHLFDKRQQRMLVREIDSVNYIGEVGLDYTENEAHREQQREVLRFILSSGAAAKVMSLHSRRAERDVLAAITDAQAEAPILHWYSGPIGLLDDALDAGCYFSINTAMIRSKKGTSLLERLPVERVLTETDGPYAKRNRRPAIPSDVRAVIEGLSRVWDVNSVDAAEQVWSNMTRLAAHALRPSSD